MAQSGSGVPSRHGCRPEARGGPPALTANVVTAGPGRIEARPLLKWAGGKRQLLPILRRHYPSQFNRYWEPFLGSGAVFFDLHARGLLDHREATLSDSNPDLVACYCAVRDFTEQVLGELSRLARDHARRGADHFYDVRDNRFNPQRAALAARNSRGVVYSPALAAMFIYLNRTGYNGLFRLNAHGEFNVPSGRYANPRICDDASLHRAAAALARNGVDIMLSSFDSIVAGARPGDFLYFDPPYAPLSRTARFTQYTADGFDHDQQTRLRDIAVTLAQRGCHVIVSNSTAPEITSLYDTNVVQAAGLRCHTVPARRAINSNPKRRGTVSEYVITNVPTAAGD